MNKFEAGQHVMFDHLPCIVKSQPPHLYNVLLLGPLGGLIYASEHNEDLVLVSKEEYTEELVIYKLTNQMESK